MEAHRAAVDAALSYMERAACWARRGKGGHEFVHGAGFLAAAYVHRSSRAGDPQLHTHVLVANATLGPDGRWSRLYHPAIYEHAKTASYIYEAHLRHELTLRLGVDWEPVGNGIADIRGFSAEELRAFSTRRAEILAAVGAGRLRARDAVAALETRQAKDRDLTDESMREGWRVRAEEIGLTRERIAAPSATTAPAAGPRRREQVERSVTAHASHFDRRDAIRAVADNLPHGAPADEVERLADAFLASSVIRIAETPRGPRFTTERIWELEREALAAAGRWRRAGGHAVADPIAVSRVLATRSTIKADQRAMVERLTRGGEGLVVVVGEAGTGKTFATVAAAEAWADSGIGCGWRRRPGGPPTPCARRGSTRPASPASSPSSTAGRAGRAPPRLRPPGRRGRDGRLGDPGAADRPRPGADAKLVLIGDPAQLGEIEAGGLFGSLVSRTDPVFLDEVIRHEHELDREGARRIREGRGAEAIEVYRSEGGSSSRRPGGAARGDGPRLVALLSRGRGRADDRQAERRGRPAERARPRGDEGRRPARRARDRGRRGQLRRRRPGDHRVNDHKAGIYNRERWLIESVDPEGRGVGLVGVDASAAGRRRRRLPGAGEPQ